jgi:hypothetical protein
MTNAARAIDVGSFRSRVFRYRKLVDGRPAWYALSPTGEPLGLRVVKNDEDEAAVVAELVEMARIAARPRLTLIKPTPRRAFDASWRLVSLPLLRSRALPPPA